MKNMFNKCIFALAHIILTSTTTEVNPWLKIVIMYLPDVSYVV